MGKKKLKQHRTHLELRRPKDTQVSPKIPYDQPFSSPYELPIVTVIVGRKRYGLPRYFIQKYPKFNQQLPWLTSIDLSDVHEDVGHTLVHFLYSGSYETIDSPLEEGESKVAREYKRAVLAYRASRTYKLPALESLAKRYIKIFSESMTTPDILRITREVFPKFFEDETWLPNHIKPSLQQVLLFGETDTNLDALHTIFGEEHSFENVMTRMTLQILSNRLRYWEDQEEKNIRDSHIKAYENENISIRESFAAGQSNGSHSNYTPEEDAVESYPEPEEALPEEAATEAYPEEDAVESYPEHEEALPEEAATEAYPEEDAVESYPKPEEALPEDAVTEAYPDEVTGVHSAMQESLPSLNKHPKLRLTQYLLENVHLYEDWKSLSPKKKEV
ncbi:hypothetical protein N7540_006764 [Penicillium herquei]|nr:hypothetical protein N7540_006764 [Penicillium herquei]